MSENPSVISVEDRVAWINTQPASTLADPRLYHICDGPMIRGLCQNEVDELILRSRGAHKGYESIGSTKFKLCFCDHRHDHVTAL